MLFALRLLLPLASANDVIAAVSASELDSLSLLQTSAVKAHSFGTGSDEFVEGDDAGCPAGYSLVSSASLCKKAALELGQHWAGKAEGHSASDPHGCFSASDYQYVYYSDHGANPGKWHESASPPICSLAPTTTTTTPASKKGGRASAECKAARADLKEKKKTRKADKAKVTAAREALSLLKATLKTSKDEVTSAKDAVAEECPQKEKEVEAKDLSNLGYIETKGVSCGWSGPTCVQAYINNGARSMTMGSDVTPCEQLCNEHEECDGFCLVGSECYFRQDTDCAETSDGSMPPTSGRSCWQRPKEGRKCGVGQFQGGTEC
jgi:hypothetical protein